MFVCILGIGLILRIATAIVLAPQPLVSDAKVYHDNAVLLLHGETYAPQWPPGLSFYLVPFYALFGESEVVSRFAMIGFHVLFAGLLYLVMSELVSRWSANVAGLAFAVYPSFIYHSVTPVTHLPAAVCLLALVWLVQRFARREWVIPAALATGLVLGGFALLRPNAMLFLALVPAYVLVRYRRWLGAALPVLVAVAMIWSWNAKASAMAGRPVMINTAHALNLFIGNNPYTPLYRTWWYSAHQPNDAGVPAGYARLYGQIKDQPAEQQDKLFRQEAVQHVMNHPGLALFRSVNRFRCFFGFDTYTGAFLVKAYHLPLLAGMGLVAVDALVYLPIMGLLLIYLFGCKGVAGYGRLCGLVLVPVAAYALPHWIAFSHPTYHLPIVPLLAVLAMAVWERMRHHDRPTPWEVIWSTPHRRNSFLLTLALLIFVQIEWAMHMAQSL